MATLRQKQIEELKRLTQEVIEDESVSVKDFAVFVQTIVDFIKQTKDDFNTELSSMKQALADNLAQTSSEITEKIEKKLSTRAEKTDVLSQKLADALANLKDGYTPKKGVDYDDGKDADPEEISEMVIAKLFPKVATKEDLKELQDFLEEFKKLKEKVITLESRPTRSMPNGGGANARNFIKEVDLSSQLDGSTKTFNIGAFYRILSVDLSSYPHALRKTTDYTYSGNDGTITFTDEIDAPSTLAAGQTCIITLVLT